MDDAKYPATSTQPWLEVTTSAGLRAMVDRVRSAEEEAGGREGVIQTHLIENGAEQRRASEGLGGIVAGLGPARVRAADPSPGDPSANAPRHPRHGLWSR